MGKADDEEQLEYIRQWQEMKEEHKRIRKDRLLLVKGYFKLSKEYFVCGIKQLLKVV